MQWAQELHSAGMSRDPADGSLDRLEAIEPYPDTFFNSRPLHEFDLAAFTRGIENPHAKAERARAPQSDLGIQIRSVGAARLLRASIGRHAQRIAEKLSLPKLERQHWASVRHCR